MGKYDQQSLLHAARVIKDFPYPAIFEMADEILASDGIIAETAVRRDSRLTAVLIAMTKCLSGDKDRTLDALERLFALDDELATAAEMHASKMTAMGFRA